MSFSFNRLHNHFFKLVQIDRIILVPIVYSHYLIAFFVVDLSTELSEGSLDRICSDLPCMLHVEATKQSRHLILSQYFIQVNGWCHEFHVVYPGVTVVVDVVDQLLNFSLGDL